ncbi:MAG: ATP-binding cassette domain-containing protein [Opitutales bacterium]|jgi:ABC-type glutathione transport system ATPase component
MPLLQCEDLSTGYPLPRGGWNPVVRNLSLEIKAGTTLALVGESGSGKSTLAKALVKLIPVREGIVRIDGVDVTHMDGKAFLPFRKRIQLVFQDPWQALNPRLEARQLLAEPLLIHSPELDRTARDAKVGELLESVHLPSAIARRLPSELSGGQRQRLLLARALAVRPKLLVCDEPVSALDVSVQAKLLELLAELKEAHGLTLLFISHDLAVVQQMADQVVVMKEGQAVESQPAEDLFRNPQHAYTRMLLEASPKW